MKYLNDYKLAVNFINENIGSYEILIIDTKNF